MTRSPRYAVQPERAGTTEITEVAVPTERVMTSERINEVTAKIIGAAIRVHRSLGPGLLESAYETCLARELDRQGLRVETQKLLPCSYQGILIERGYRLDLLVEGTVVVELKAVDRLLPVHEAQILSYLKLSGLRIGLLINFNVKLLKHGVRRFVR